MNTVTIYWYRSNGPVSRLIRFVTRSRYSHVALRIGDWVYEATGDGLFAWGPDVAALRVAQACAFQHVALIEGMPERVQVWLDEITDATRTKTYAVPGRYSVLALLAAGIGSIGGRRMRAGYQNEYICSGLVAAALYRAWIELPYEPSTMTPEDLADLFPPVEMRH